MVPEREQMRDPSYEHSHEIYFSFFFLSYVKQKKLQDFYWLQQLHFLPLNWLTYRRDKSKLHILHFLPLPCRVFPPSPRETVRTGGRKLTSNSSSNSQEACHWLNCRVMFCCGLTPLAVAFLFPHSN